ncbi:MAG: hypothetical protein U9P71_03430 [Campylobacterota bacterium]|nr:hypothetical protein [Campylobacterota bacterium]
MKIENFTMQMHSEHTETSIVSRSFVEELEGEAIKRSEEIEAVNREMELFKRLEFELIEQLIASLESRKHHFNQLDVQQFEKRKISFYEERIEHESLDVNMNACIQTASQNVQISMNVSFSHTFVQQHQITRGEFYDPLVVNFDDTLPDLSDECFSFDIDCDGTSDQLSLLKQGNGFLALDSNGNNKIDDGSELFGTKNGNGFVDLAKYDSDNNSWIDENDPILEKLRIWINNEDENRLVALGELGIGALYLGYTGNPFEIKNSENETLGRIRSNGMYLNKNGTGGLMTQIDFAKHDKQAGRKLETTDLKNLLQAV